MQPKRRTPCKMRFFNSGGGAAIYDAEQSSVFSWAVLLTRSRVIDHLRARGRRLRVVVSSTDDDDSRARTADASTAESAADTADRNEAAGRVRSVLSSHRSHKCGAGRAIPSTTSPHARQAPAVSVPAKKVAVVHLSLAVFRRSCADRSNTSCSGAIRHGRAPLLQPDSRMALRWSPLRSPNQLFG